MTGSSPIRGVVFDFGGVLADMRWDVAHALEATHDLPRGAIVRALYATPAWEAVQRGRGDRAAWLEDAHRRLEAQAGHPLPRLHDAWRSAQHLLREHVALVRTLRTGYRTAILSNADDSLPGRLRQAGLGHLFDAIVCSAEVGIAKPEAAIYRLAAARLDLPPEACAFVDDAEPNVAAAREVGMRGIVFRVDRGDDLGALLRAAGVAAP